jgi:hypothetical protein
MHRQANSLINLISNPFRTVGAYSKSLATLGLGLAALTPAGAQNPVSAQKLSPQSLSPVTQPAAASVPRPHAIKAGETTALQPVAGLTTLPPKVLPPAVIPPLKAIKHPHVNRTNVNIDPRKNTITWPNGNKASLSQMRRQFGDTEDQLNVQGYSLFDPDAPSLELAPNIDYSLLESQRQELVNHQLNSRPKKAAGSNATFEEFVDHNYPWSWSVGNPNFFQVSLNSNLSIYIDDDFLYTSADGEADGAILGQNFNVARAFTSASSYQGNVTGSFVFEVLGNYVMDWSTQQSATWTWNWSYQQEIAEPYHVWIGPVPVGGRVGIRGSIGCDLSLGLYGSAVSGSVTPYVDTSGFAEVGVDIWFAGAGVGGELTFLNCSFPNVAGLYLQSDQYGNLEVVDYVQSHLDISTLSGSFYIWAQLFGDYSYWTLWSWNGISWSDDLWNYSETTYL